MSALPSPDDYPGTAEVDGYAVPESLKDMEIWVLWDEKTAQGKVPLAPWETGNCYPAAWGGDVDERPETDYTQVRSVCTMGPETVHEHYPFPPADQGDPDAGYLIPDTLTPTILLPHDPPDPPLMQVDFDDVRNPETGTISTEVVRIVRRLSAYTEVSQSGEGLHCFVRAELPGSLGKFIADLDEHGEIEMYDHGRFVGATWQHVEGTPMEVPERQDVVDSLVEEYEDESQRERRLRSRAQTADIETDMDSSMEELVRQARGGETKDSDDSNRSPYFDHIPRTKDLANTGYFARYRSKAPGPDTEGPHPGHGPESSDPEECTNFGITGDGGWYCFAHDSGGGSLALYAVLNVGGIVCADVRDDATGLRTPARMLAICLQLREDADGALEDADPPYMALRGVAEQHDLAMKDPEGGILGKQCWRIARVIFDQMDPEDAEL